VETYGLDAVMGSDQAHIHRIFLPGQADWHYQHLCRVRGTVRIGDQAFEVDGRGGKDHSRGPRNWLAKIYLRWLIAFSDDGVQTEPRTRYWDGGRTPHSAHLSYGP